VLAVGVALIALTVLAVFLSRDHRASDDYAPFAYCPLHNPATDVCISARTEGGELRIGKRTIPIVNTITLQGGVHDDEATGKQQFIEAEKDKTLSVTPEIIPGGLRDIMAPEVLPKTLRRRFDELIARGDVAVTATTELVPASEIGVNTQNLIEAKGTGLALPVKVKLSNPFLGASCYIGSDAQPIMMSLTTGTTRRSSRHGPIRGKPGHAKFKDDYNLVTISADSLVSDSFAAPRVEGCSGINSSGVDPALDAGLGLPVAPGGNEAILNGALRDANAPAVRASR
jgi:hypothetical protein